MDSTDNLDGEMRRSRKKVDSCYSRRVFKNVRHPHIRLSGIYLEKFGFHIGEEVEVVCTNGVITIRKIEPDSSPGEMQKT